MKNSILAANAFVAGTLIAEVGTWGENVGCYGVLGFMTFRFFQREHAETERSQYPAILLKTWRSLLVEFGPIEIFDSILIRPGFMGAFPALLGNVGWGVFLGAIAADVLFYAVWPPLSRKFFPNWVRGD